MVGEAEEEEEERGEEVGMREVEEMEEERNILGDREGMIKKWPRWELRFRDSVVRREGRELQSRWKSFFLRIRESRNERQKTIELETKESRMGIKEKKRPCHDYDCKRERDVRAVGFRVRTPK